jgi:hypothetical protein
MRLQVAKKILLPSDSSSKNCVVYRWYPTLDYLVATKIRHALAFILDNFPDAAGAMNLVYPQRKARQ